MAGQTEEGPTYRNKDTIPLPIACPHCGSKTCVVIKLYVAAKEGAGTLEDALADFEAEARRQRRST